MKITMEALDRVRAGWKTVLEAFSRGVINGDQRFAHRSVPSHRTKKKSLPRPAEIFPRRPTDQSVRLSPATRSGGRT